MVTLLLGTFSIHANEESGFEYERFCQRTELFLENLQRTQEGWEFLCEEALTNLGDTVLLLQKEEDLAGECWSRTCRRERGERVAIGKKEVQNSRRLVKEACGDLAKINQEVKETEETIEKDCL